MTLDRRTFIQAGAAGALATSPLFHSAQAAEPGVVRWLMAENTTGNWDPAANTTLANVLCENLSFNQLMTYPMKPGTDPTTPELGVVAAYKVTGPFTVDIELRKGVKFHSGDELTAEDVKASMEHYSQPKIGRPFYNGPITGVVKNKYALTLNTEGAGMPATKFLFMQYYSPILRAKDIADKKALQVGMNGTGPFRLVGQEKGSVIFEANKNYWGPSKPQLKRIIVRHVPDSNARVLAMLSGEAELIERMEPEQFASLKGKPGIITSKLKSVESKFLMFRNNKKPFDDWRMRRAASMAIDRDAILGLLGDAAYASDSVLPPMKLGHIAMPDYGKFNPKECQRLMAEAGYPGGKGLPELEYITSTGFYPKTKEYCEAITSMLQAQGFPVKLSVMEVAAWNERQYNTSIGHLVDSGWAASTPEPDVQLVFMYFSKVGLFTGCNDPEIDASLLKEMAMPDLAARRKVIETETLPLIGKKMPNLALFNSNMLHAYSSKIKGLNILPDGVIQFDKASWA